MAILGIQDTSLWLGGELQAFMFEGGSYYILKMTSFFNKVILMKLSSSVLTWSRSSKHGGLMFLLD